MTKEKDISLKCSEILFGNDCYNFFNFMSEYFGAAECNIPWLETPAAKFFETLKQKLCCGKMLVKFLEIDESTEETITFNTIFSVDFINCKNSEVYLKPKILPTRNIKISIDFNKKNLIEDVKDKTVLFKKLSEEPNVIPEGVASAILTDIVRYAIEQTGLYKF